MFLSPIRPPARVLALGVIARERAPCCSTPALTSTHAMRGARAGWAAGVSVAFLGA